MNIKTVNITDKIPTHDAEKVTEIVTDALQKLGVNPNAYPYFSWNLEVDYEVTK